MALENKNITIHIGMPKAASTTLQNKVFIKMLKAQYAGAGNRSKLSRLFLDLIKLEESYFDMDDHVKQMKKLLNPNKPVILSSEFACSYLSPLGSGIPQSKTRIANRLADLAPDAKIMIIIRNQFDLHKSLFSQLLHNESDFLSFKKAKFEKWIDKNISLSQRNWSSVFELADYKTLIELYQERFKRVKVFIFEEIIEDMEGFVKGDLSEFLEIKNDSTIENFTNSITNQRHNIGDIKTESALDKLAQTLKRKFGNPLTILSDRTKETIREVMISSANKLSHGKIKTEYTQDQQEFLKNYYRESNRITSELIQVELSKYGYPM